MNYATKLFRTVTNTTSSLLSQVGKFQTFNHLLIKPSINLNSYCINKRLFHQTPPALAYTIKKFGFHVKKDVGDPKKYFNVNVLVSPHSKARRKPRINFEHPNEVRRIHKHGYHARMSTRAGREIIMRRLLKGRHCLTH